MLKVPEQHRITKAVADRIFLPGHAANMYVTTAAYENNGWFIVPNPVTGQKPLMCMVSDGERTSWEHISVTVAKTDRCPTWEEMCYVKELFWNEPEDVVVQFHPAKSEYVNQHSYCLHLWRPVGLLIPTPPSILVGRK